MNPYLHKNHDLVTLEGNGSALHPFFSKNQTNSQALTAFFNFVLFTPIENATCTVYLVLSAGESQTQFIIGATKNMRNNLEFTIGTDLGYKPSDHKSIEDLKDLFNSIRTVAIPGFSLTEGSFGDWTNQVHTIIKREGDQTIIIGERDNIPFLDTTKQLIEA